MHRRFHHFHRFSAATAVTFLGILASCTGGDGAEPEPTSTAPVAAAAPTQTTLSQAATRLPWPEGQPVQQSPWVRDRLAAMKQLFGFTEDGEGWIDGYDLRQMAGQPAWFGSFGYGSWAGAGEAVPRSVLHEISHSYWGAFSVEGESGLSWDSSDGPPEALRSYRSDLLTFIEQPADSFEPLRSRFRGMPNLFLGDYPDLYHFGEADMLYMTGGNLELVPPILRPYFSGFLGTGGVSASDGNTPTSWADALAWFNGLPAEDRRIAGEVFGLQHFLGAGYTTLPDSELNGLDEAVRTVYENEERQRLLDFAEQFDEVLEREFSFVDAAGVDRGFDFWRSYLSDKLELHRRYPDVLPGSGAAGADNLAAALDLYLELSDLDPARQVERFTESRSQPRVVELAVLLKSRAIVELFSDDGGSEGVAAVLGARAERLSDLVQAVDRVEQLSSSPGGGTEAAAQELERFITSVPENELGGDMFLLLDLLRSAGPGLSARVLPALSDDALQLLLRIQPAAARSPEISPARLLKAVGITDESSLEQLASGAAQLTGNSAGNFAIDAPYDEAMFAQFDRFMDSAPAEVLSAIPVSGLRLAPWIVRDGDGLLRAMRAAPQTAAEVLAGLPGPREFPWRMVHLVAGKDPSLAATITIEIDALAIPGQSAIERVIREFGYDLYWFERDAPPNMEPARFAEFLLSLREELTEARLVTALRNDASAIATDVSGGQVDVDAMEEFRRTAAAAVDATPDPAAQTLRSMFEEAGVL